MPFNPATGPYVYEYNGMPPQGQPGQYPLMSAPAGGQQHPGQVPHGHSGPQPPMYQGQVPHGQGNFSIKLC